MESTISLDVNILNSDGFSGDEKKTAQDLIVDGSLGTKIGIVAINDYIPDTPPDPPAVPKVYVYSSAADMVSLANQTSIASIVEDAIGSTINSYDRLIAEANTSHQALSGLSTVVEPGGVSIRTNIAYFGFKNSGDLSSFVSSIGITTGIVVSVTNILFASVSDADLFVAKEREYRWSLIAKIEKLDFLVKSATLNTPSISEDSLQYAYTRKFLRTTDKEIDYKKKDGALCFEIDYFMNLSMVYYAYVCGQMPLDASYAYETVAAPDPQDPKKLIITPMFFEDDYEVEGNHVTLRCTRSGFITIRISTQAQRDAFANNDIVVPGVTRINEESFYIWLKKLPALPITLFVNLKMMNIDEIPEIAAVFGKTTGITTSDPRYQAALRYELEKEQEAKDLLDFKMQQLDMYNRMKAELAEVKLKADSAYYLSRVSGYDQYAEDIINTGSIIATIFRLEAGNNLDLQTSITPIVNQQVSYGTFSITEYGAYTYEITSPPTGDVGANVSIPIKLSATTPSGQTKELWENLRFYVFKYEPKAQTETLPEITLNLSMSSKDGKIQILSNHSKMNGTLTGRDVKFELVSGQPLYGTISKTETVRSKLDEYLSLALSGGVKDVIDGVDFVINKASIRHLRQGTSVTISDILVNRVREDITTKYIPVDENVISGYMEVATGYSQSIDNLEFDGTVTTWGIADKTVWEMRPLYTTRPVSWKATTTKTTIQPYRVNLTIVKETKAILETVVTEPVFYDSFFAQGDLSYLDEGEGYQVSYIPVNNYDVENGLFTILPNGKWVCEFDPVRMQGIDSGDTKTLSIPVKYTIDGEISPTDRVVTIRIIGADNIDTTNLSVVLKNLEASQIHTPSYNELDSTILTGKFLAKRNNEVVSPEMVYIPFSYESYYPSFYFEFSNTAGVYSAYYSFGGDPFVTVNAVSVLGKLNDGTVVPDSYITFYFRPYFKYKQDQVWECRLNEVAKNSDLPIGTEIYYEIPVGLKRLTGINSTLHSPIYTSATEVTAITLKLTTTSPDFVWGFLEYPSSTSIAETDVTAPFGVVTEKSIFNEPTIASFEVQGTYGKFIFERYAYSINDILLEGCEVYISQILYRYAVVGYKTQFAKEGVYYEIKKLPKYAYKVTYSLADYDVTQLFGGEKYIDTLFIGGESASMEITGALTIGEITDLSLNNSEISFTYDPGGRLYGFGDLYNLVVGWLPSNTWRLTRSGLETWSSNYASANYTLSGNFIHSNPDNTTITFVEQTTESYMGDFTVFENGYWEFKFYTPTYRPDRIKLDQREHCIFTVTTVQDSVSATLFCDILAPTFPMELVLTGSLFGSSSATYLKQKDDLILSGKITPHDYGATSYTFAYATGAPNGIADYSTPVTSEGLTVTKVGDGPNNPSYSLSLQNDGSWQVTIPMAQYKYSVSGSNFIAVGYVWISSLASNGTNSSFKYVRLYFYVSGYDMPTETVSSVGVYAILEGNSPQTTSGVITYFDYEFGVPSVSSKNILGVYGTFSYYIEHQLENRGTAYWSYTTEDSVESLVEGQTVTEIFSIRSYSGTVLSVVSIDVTGTGEVAVVSNPQSIAAYRSSIFYKTGKLQNVVDADLGENKYVPQFQTQGTYGLFSVDENGDWSYSANFESAFSQNGVLITETFTVSSHDGSASTTITIDIIDDTVIYEPYTLLTASKLGGVVIDSNDPVDGDYLIATSATSAEWTTL